MRFIWDKDDVYVARKLSRPAMLEVWMIGYIYDKDSKKKYVLISLNDGLVTAESTREEMADTLTEGCYVPLEFLPPK